jgi:hypothetical protein
MGKGLWAMSDLEDEDEYVIIESPLCTRVENENTFVDIRIYREEKDDFWILEVIDEEWGSTIWEDQFPTDQAALKEALDTIEKEGLEVFLQDEYEEEKPTVH